MEFEIGSARWELNLGKNSMITVLNDILNTSYLF